MRQNKNKKILFGAVFFVGSLLATPTDFTYAESAASTIFDIKYMQEMTAAVCSNTTTPSTTIIGSVTYDTTGAHQGNATYVPRTTLTDVRDGTKYTIVKLADGNCWMQENLALGTSDPDGLTLTPDDSDVSNDWTLPVYEVYGATWSDTDSNAHVVQGMPAEGWTEGMGNYYTYNAATAGTGADLTTGEATASICPKGWQLASNSGAQSFENLANTYGITNSAEGSTLFRSDPLLFAYASFYDYGNGVVDRVVREDANYGYYWTSAAYDSDSAWSMTFSPSDAYAQYYDCRSSGSSVRCVASIEGDQDGALVNSDTNTSANTGANSTANNEATTTLGAPDTGENGSISLNEMPAYLVVVAVAAGGLTFGVIQRQRKRQKVDFNEIREY